jgi:hypothetical protein
MSRLSILLSLACLAVALGGCTTDSQRMARLGPAEGVVSGSIQSMGGLDQWRRAGTIEANARVAVWADDGTFTVSRQRQTIDLLAGTIRAVATVPGGRWTASTDLAGDFSFSDEGFQAATEFVEAIRSVLDTEIHRLRGPLNLLGPDEGVQSRDDVRILGEPLVRVGVGGDNTRAIAYYFEPVSSMLKYVTTGADRAGADGTVTTYQWGMLPGGLALPTQLRVTRLGRNVLIGSEPVMEIELRDVEARQ